MMQAAAIQAELTAMNASVGLLGSALADMHTGLLWAATDALENRPLIAEAACDYWRLYLRHREYFADLGEMRAQVLIHSKQRLTILGINENLVLISLSDEKSAINWHQWKSKAANLQQQLQAS